MLTFSTDWVTVLGIVLGVVLPLVVNVITKISTTPAVRGTLLAALALVTTLLTQIDHALVDHAEFNVGNALVVALGTFLVGAAAAWGIWNPTNVSSYLREKVGVKEKPDA